MAAQWQGAVAPCHISLFVVCTIFRTGPSAVFAIRLAAFVLGAVLAVLKGRVLTVALIAVMIAAVQIAAAGFPQLITLETAAINTVGFKFPNRHFITPIAHILLRLCLHGLRCLCRFIRFLRRAGCWFRRLLEARRLGGLRWIP